MRTVELFRRQAEDEIRRPAVTDHALGAAWIMPGERLAARFLVHAVGADGVRERGFGLLVVPDVRVTGPFAFLSSKQAGFNPSPL